MKTISRDQLNDLIAHLNDKGINAKVRNVNLDNLVTRPAYRQLIPVDSLDEHDLADLLWEQPYRYYGLMQYAQIDLNNGDDSGMMFMMMVQDVMTRHYKNQWNGLDLNRVEPMSRYDVVSRSGWAWREMDQASFNFFTCSDLKDMEQGLHFKSGTEQPYFYSDLTVRITEDQERLAEAFVKQMTEEADAESPIISKVPMGNYVLGKVALPLIDEYIEYSSIRLVITRSGLYVTIVGKSRFFNFAWYPHSHLGAWQAGHKLGVLFNIFLSCLWRDCCVVQEKIVKQKVQLTSITPKKKRSKNYNYLILPRTVYKAEWAPDEQREIIARTAHGVRAHYRRLLDGAKASEGAAENAEMFGFPAPPDGYTFVQPHTRGDGEPLPTQPKRIIAKGLHVARIALANIEVAA
jgi:hypothetical protein